MPGETVRIRLEGRLASREVNLAAFLDARAAEAAETEANRWIKSLRHARIGESSLRDRFLYRGDSLWWFAELYLHKLRVPASILRTIGALEELMAREHPSAIELISGDRIVHTLAPLVATRHGVACRTGLHPPAASPLGSARIGARGLFYAATAAARGTRNALRTQFRPRQTEVVAFVHAAFWRGSGTDGDEGYIGPVLHELGKRLPDGELHLVGVGPRTNFRARRWRDRWREFRTPSARGLPFTPVGSYASWNDIQPSIAWWTQRHAVRRALLASSDVREAACIRGYDAWPLLRLEFDGIACLQFPWAVRAMGESAAALDALDPAVVVTYAEAGGWGRAIILEARRRQIPAVGLQHGFIYRHWLNYLHEPDEMQPSPANPADRGFPRPDLTVLYDQYAADHLVERGAFPPSALLVAGSPRLDDFVATARALSADDRQRIRQTVGVRPGQQLVVVATKFSQIAPVFPALVRAVADRPDVRLIVKCHPAETPAPYEAAAAGIGTIGVAPPDADLAALIACARLVVTVNSTAAIEAIPLDVPALVVGLPNNLSPLVDAGAVAGTEKPDEIGPLLTALLYDEERRAALAQGRRAFVNRYRLTADGQAAARAADAILAAARGGTGRG